jgi:hypothetical protein
LNLLYSLPKTIIATVIIGLAIIFIVFTDPPKTVCQVQQDSFMATQVGFITPDPKKKKEQKESDFERFLSYCKQSHFKQGACFELFAGLKKMLNQVKSISYECLPSLGENGRFNSVLWKTLKFLTETAWGEKPPESRHLKLNWLDSSTVGLYCQLKKLAIETRGTGYWGKWARGTVAQLPGSKQMQTDESWGLSLLSVNCNSYR